MNNLQSSWKEKLLLNLFLPFVVSAITTLITIYSQEHLPFLPKSGSGCIEGDCETGNGTYRYRNGDSYTGHFVKGKKDGHGTLKTASGGEFNGLFSNDKLITPEDSE